MSVMRAPTAVKELNSPIQRAENIHFISETKKNTRTARAVRTLGQ